MRMLIEASKEITSISDNSEINTQNYLEFISYIDNLYRFINRIKLVIPTNSFKFLPSFKGRYTCEKFSIPSSEKENDLKVIIIEPLENCFFEDTENFKKKINDTLGSICDFIEITTKKIIFTLM